MSDRDLTACDLSTVGPLTELDRHALPCWREQRQRGRGDSPERERPARPEGGMSSVRRWIVGSPAANKALRWLWLAGGIAVFATGVHFLVVVARPPFGVRHLALIGLTEFVMSAGSAVGVARFTVSFDPPPR
jgi:hypothetical protein